MPDSISLTEIAGQHAELLPDRTVLSLIGFAEGGQCGGHGGIGGAGGDGEGGLGVQVLPIALGGDQFNIIANVVGGNGGDANGGPCH